MRKGKRFLAGICALALIFSFTPVGGYLPGDAGVEEAKAAESGDWEYKELEDGTVEITRYTGTSKELTIPETIAGKKVTRIGDYAFSESGSLTVVTIPNSITSIGKEAFFDCDNLTMVTIPESITSIGTYAFCDCAGLTSILIPENVAVIGENAFANCSKLKEITVNEKNKIYSSKDGDLYDKAQTKLIQYAIGKADSSFNVPGSVKTIENGAFAMNSNLTSIIISKGVTSIGDDSFYGCANLISITIPEGVTKIGDWAFQLCRSLASVTIPKSVTSIGYSAFSGCANLTSLTISGNVTDFGAYAFHGCVSLTSLTILDGVTSIGSFAFMGCRNLTSVKIPESVVTIEPFAFCFCDSLASVTIPKSVKKIGDNAFNRCISLASITIPEGVTTIGDWAFEGCIELRLATIPESVTTIGDSIFARCSKLKEITVNGKNKFYSSKDGNLYNKAQTRLIQYAVGKSATSFNIPESVTSIEDSAFENCSSLATVAIPGSVASIGNSAFENCSSLATITISESVTSIGFWAFRNCNNLASIKIPESVTSIGTSVFTDCSKLKEITVNEKNKEYSSKDGNLYDKAQKKLIQYAVGKQDTTFSIPGSVTSIGDNAFSGCVSLTSITIPKGVTEIGTSAFSDCVGLISILIPEGVANIGEYTFSGCTKLASVTFPDGITNIDYSAFEDCSSLTTVTIPESVTTIGSAVFAGCTKLKEIIVNEKNKFYSSKDGNLYNRAQTSLLQYALGKTDLSYVIPEGVTDIREGAFSGCGSLNLVSVPKSVTTIGSGAFANCSKLKEIIVDEKNKNYSSKDGNLYDKAQTRLIQYAIGKTESSFVIPESVKTIDNFAFSNCANLTSITIPKNVTNIWGEPFAGCKNVVIKGYKNSYVQIYAKQHNIKFTALDDRESYKVTFNSAGGSAVAAQTVAEGETAAKPADPTKKGYIFAGWYNGSTKYDFSKAVTGNLTLTAKWTYQCSTPSISKAENANGGVKLTWGKVTGAAKYRVFYKKNGKWTKIADTTGTSYTWKGAKSGTKYTFTVRCVSSDGKSFTSGYNASGKSIRYLAQPEIKKFEANNSGLKITWGKVTGASKYRVYYKTAKGWKQLRETSGTSCTINATLGKSYTYTVRAFNGSDSSTYNKSGKAFKRVATPKLSSAANVKGGVKISWGRVSGAQKYRVFYKKNGKWTKLADTTSTSYTWKKAKKGTTYTFTVRCINSKASAYTSGYNTAGKKVKYNGK